MRKQPLPKSQLRQAILRCVTISSASLIVSTTLSMAQTDLPNLDVPFVTGPTACDYTYGVNDGELNNSQFFRIFNGVITPIGPTYFGYDIEALDVSDNGDIYVAAGDNSDVGKPGYLYKLSVDGGLTEVCPTGYAEVDGLTFNPISKEWYAWAQDAGLLHITIPPEASWPTTEACGELIYESTGEFEDLTFSNDGNTLYVVKNEHGAYPHPSPYTLALATYYPDPENDSQVPHHLIAYDMGAGMGAPICDEEISSLGEIEALEIDVSGNLLIGYHSSVGKPMMATLEPGPCDITTKPVPTYPSDTGITNFGDIEAIGVCPCVDPPSTEWDYAYDPVRDQTGLRALDIRGMAVRMLDGNFIVAINASMPVSGTDVPAAMTSVRDLVVSWSDIVINFANGKQVAIHFAQRSNSGVTEPGLYDQVHLMDVSKPNGGHSKLSEYLAVVEGVDKKDHLMMGDMDLPSDYFPMNQEYSLAMSIETGTKVPNDGYQDLSAAQLKAMGLDFEQYLDGDVGPYTFGFAVKRQSYMHGSFIMSLFTECSNDGIAIIGELPECQ
jgi:hypothetical protein